MLARSWAVTVRIGACQTPEILGDVDAAVRCIKGLSERAEAEGADLLLFPECFLPGYLLAEAHVRRHALDLGSAGFRSVAARLADARPVLVTGMIERAGSRLHNSAVGLDRARSPGSAARRTSCPARHFSIQEAIIRSSR
jgi:predicted amidohydrolase